MAEAVGLAIGVVALAGTFKDCIDLFSYISASRNLGRDLELLETKLDVEKTLLLQWAARVRLLQPNYDSRLDQLDISRVIARLLASIQLLLSDSQTLQDRYGVLSEHQDYPSTGIQVVSGPAYRQQSQMLSTSRMAEFMADFDKLRVRASQMPKAVSVRSRVRWAIHDKEKFGDLVQKLSYCVSRLDAVVPDTNGLLDGFARQDVSILGFDKLRMVQIASIGRDSLLARSAEQFIQENCKARILSLFWYRVMDDRRSGLTNAHSCTLGWVLQPRCQESECEWDDLSQWLSHDSGLYWISGKAGCGKSTLMKYLYEHKTTKVLLERWAGHTPLTMANFFFYALGSREQKSQDGLSRALLYQILSAEPSLIPTLFPSMWQEASTSENVQLRLPSESEIKIALEKVGNGLDVERKFCFFIDGLDEYAGDYMVGIAFIENLVRNPDIKVIVASRPIPSCFQAFSQKPKLRLQDLNKDDIMGYIDDVIGQHPYMKYLAFNGPNMAPEIVNQLLRKASGVFLWVVLACSSLIAGFAAYDNAAELLARVDELPPELQNLFRHMLGTIEPRYRAQAAKILRVCHEAQLGNFDTLPSIAVAMVDELDMDACRTSLVGTISDDQKHTKCIILEGRLRSRCCGLLELSWLPGFSLEEGCYCGKQFPYHDKLVDSTVTFIHRTVFDFFNQPGAWNYDYIQLPDTLFDPRIVLSRIQLQSLALGDRDALFGSLAGKGKLLKAVFNASRDDDGSSSPGSIGWIVGKVEELFQSLPQSDLSYRFGFSDFDLAHCLTCPFPLTTLIAAEAGLVNFVTNAIQHARPNPSQLHVLWLHALRQPLLRCSISPPMVRCLLSWGSGPNMEFPESKNPANKQTPWKVWMRELKRVRLGIEVLNAADVVKAFLEAGAYVDDETQSALLLFLNPVPDYPPAIASNRKFAELRQSIRRLVQEQRDEGVADRISCELKPARKRSGFLDNEEPAKRIRTAAFS
ncbi:hypothetical protein HD806DRAFT_444015 [Xylariaceae sp. AK1471]|nr:hypothetical protein HD806DRAFT_444015 [Xylariaceae sp. AK1471]